MPWQAVRMSMQEAHSSVSLYRGVAERLQVEVAALRSEQGRLQVPIMVLLHINCSC